MVRLAQGRLLKERKQKYPQRPRSLQLAVGGQRFSGFEACDAYYWKVVCSSGSSAEASCMRQVWAVLIAVAASAAFAAAPVAVLDLPGGGVLPGTLLPATADAGGDRETLAWRSPAFAGPLEFHLDEIAGVRFTSSPVEQPPAAFRFILSGGDLLDGAIEAIDSDHVTLTPRGTDRPVRVRRDVIEGVSRIGSRIAGSYVGPGGLAGWRHEPEGVWRSEAGHIVAARPGTALIDVVAPTRAIYDIVISWRHRPELRLSAAATERPGDEGYWVELLRLQDGTPEAAIIRREQELAAVEPLGAGDAATRSLRVVMFVDQEKGRLAAYTVDRGVAGSVSEVVVPPANREPSGRFRISLGTGDVSLESLRVGPWTTDEPVLDVRRATSVVCGDGRTIDGEIASYDKASGEVLVRAAAGDVRIGLDEIEEIVLPRPDRDQAVANSAPATLRLVQASGGTIAGRLASVDERSLRLRVAGIDDEVAVPLDDVLSLTSLVALPSPRELPGRVGTLIAGEASLKGCLVEGRDLGAEIAWLPQGAVEPAALAVPGDGVDAIVEYVPRPSREPIGEAQVEIGGIGGMVNQDALGFFVVTMLSEDGAAAQDGRLQPGDRLLAIKPRPEGGFVPTKGHDVQTVMNLMRGRVGSQVVMRVAAADGEPRDIDLRRGLIYVAGREILDQALATHTRLASPAVLNLEDSVKYPSLAILRSGDVVPCAVDGMDAKGMRIRTPVADGGANDEIVVSESLVQAVELDPSVPARDIEKPQFDRLRMLPRSQRVTPPTHMVRLRDGDYLRGRLESLDDATLVLDVRGEVKRLPRNAVARVIWLHPEEESADAPPRDALPIPAGLLVQGVAEGRRVTLVAEGLAEGAIRGTSLALGPGRIDLKGVDRLLLGRAIDGEADQLPYRQWKLRPAPEPKALREAAAAK